MIPSVVDSLGLVQREPRSFGYGLLMLVAWAVVTVWVIAKAKREGDEADAKGERGWPTEDEMFVG